MATDNTLWTKFEEILSKSDELHFWWRDDDVRVSNPQKLLSALKNNSRLKNTLALLHKYNIPAIYAVIPENFLEHGAKQIQLLKKYHAFIALHGINHKNNAIAGTNEFPDDCDNEKALKTICAYQIKFKEIFGDALLSSFVPPYNTINPTLEQMLLTNGFYKVSKVSIPNDEKPYHVDIDFMNWEITKMKSEQTILTEIITLLEQGKTTIGFNNHYRCINRSNRQFFQKLFHTIAQFDNVKWIMPL